MFTLKYRRGYLDLIECYNIISGVSNVDYKTRFVFAGDVEHRVNRSTEYQKNILKPYANLDIRRNFFSIRVSDKWNALPNEIKESRSVNQFK